MAMGAGVVWQVQNGANDANGGGFRGGCELTTPSAPSVAISSGGSVTNATYWVVVTLVTGNGETSQSPESSVTSAGANHTITVTAPPSPVVQGATWSVYFGTASGGPYFLGTAGSTLSFSSNYVITVTPPTSGTQAPGTDRSLGNSANVVIENSAITATTTGANSNTLTFTLGYVPTAADVGNVVHLTAGTNIRAGWYEITGWSATTWTLAGGGNATTAGGAGSAITGNMGGALTTPGGLGAAVASDGVASQKAYINYNASAYSCTSTANASGGRYNASAGITIVGYDTTRTLNNTDANRPILDAGSASMTVLQPTGGASYQRNLSVTNSAARASVTAYGVGIYTERCKADSCAIGFSLSGVGWTVDCFANSCTTGFTTATGGCWFERCVSLGCVTSFNINAANTYFVECVAKGGTGVGFNTTGGNFVAVNCISRDNSGGSSHGFSGGGAVQCINCIAWNNGGTDYNVGATAKSILTRIWNCAGQDALPASGVAGVDAISVRNFVTITVDPNTNATGGDLSLNNTAGGGALCRGAGLPGNTSTTQLTGLSTLAYPDLGVAQTQTTVGSLIVGCSVIQGLIG